MSSLNKIIASAFFLIFIRHACAAEAIIFDNPNFVVIDLNGSLMGFYDARDVKSSCSFLFSQVGSAIKRAQSPYSEEKIITFVPGSSSLVFSRRDRKFDIFGALYRRDETWFVRTDTGQAGCENALGEFVFYPRDKVGGAIFDVVERIRAKEIRLVQHQSFFYDLRAGEYVSRKTYLTRGNAVVVLKTRDKFSYVRFADPRVNVSNPGRVTTGWIRTDDLVDPFPANAKH